MKIEGHELSVSVVISVAHTELEKAGFKVTRDVSSTALPQGRAFLAEDSYSVIAFVAYDTWSQLEQEWLDAQAELVELISKRLSRTAPKAWDGYLILVCANAGPDDATISLIERDTSRVRKIVGTADTIRTTTDIAHLLDPFMPLTLPTSNPPVVDILARLPAMLSADVPIPVTEAVAKAFKQMEPLLERLNDLGGNS